MANTTNDRMPHPRFKPQVTADLSNTIDYKLFMLLLNTASSVRKAAIRELEANIRRTEAEIREMKERQKNPPVENLTDEERNARIREILGV